jgi:CHAD domain-containing protein
MKSVKIYFKHRLLTFSALLKNTSVPYNSESFHQLRIEIKKLAAFFKLLKFCSKDFPRKKNLQPYKIIFDQAGIVRELEIVKTIVDKSLPASALPGYNSYLKRITAKECVLFFTILKKHPLRSSNATYKKISPFISCITEKKSSHYLDKLYKRLYDVSGKKNAATAKQQHDLRKLLKIIVFTKKSLELQNNEPTNKQEHALTQELGTWHDDYVTIRYLQKALRLKEIPPQEKQELKTIVARLRADNQLLVKKINNSKAELRATNKWIK